MQVPSLTKHISPSETFEIPALISLIPVDSFEARENDNIIVILHN